MKKEERIAERFLADFLKTQPQYEPLGKNKPPDFSIGGAAFEVRRLNQQFVGQDGSLEGLEVVGFALHEAVRGELAKVPFTAQSGTYYWGITFERPLPKSPSKLAGQFVRDARAHYAANSRQSKEIPIGKAILSLIPRQFPNGQAFIYGMTTDLDTPGFVGSIYRDNIRLALEEKITKTERIASRFNWWGLLLVDAIQFPQMGIREMGQPNLNLKHFASLVILDSDGNIVFDWPTGSLSELNTLQSIIRQSGIPRNEFES